MRVAEARRITGRHLWIDGPGAAAELTFADDDVDAAINGVKARVEGASADVLGVPAALAVHRHPGGASMAVRAPPDRLETAATLLEWAAGAVGFEEVLAARDREDHPRLRRLYDQTDLPIFHDDDGVTVGLGARSRTWPLDDPPDALPADVGRIPVVYVTGTNGKTTTTRILARIATAAGFVPGHTSSDGVVVGGEWVAEGDWTGPGAARQVLRDRRVTFAALETARGGLMRRGLAVDGADVAVITNVATDHLGEWGLHTVDDMAQAKLVVARGLRPGGRLVVNGRCAPLVARVAAEGWTASTFADGEIADLWADAEVIRWRGGRVLARLDEIPVTIGGAARHNVENALAAALAAHHAGIGDEAIVDGLRSFRPSLEESRGRLNRYRLASGAEVILDFAHNPHGIDQVVTLALALPARRRSILLGQAGDRGDADILALAASAARLRPEIVVLKELVGKLRGRAPGEVPALLRRGLAVGGVPDDAILDAPDEASGCRRILALAEPGDLVLYLVHGELGPALEALDAHGATPIG